jgi:hypothetical protein
MTSLAAHTYMLFANLAGQPAAGPPGATGEQCVTNIGPAERRIRLMAGVVGMALGLAGLAGLLRLGADRWWRLALLPVFWGAAVGFFQWRDKT